MVNTTLGPRMIHEGEMKVPQPDGSTRVIPNHRISPDEQQRLTTLERRSNVPGYQFGGSFMPNWENIKQKSADSLNNALGGDKQKDNTNHQFGGSFMPNWENIKQKSAESLNNALGGDKQKDNTNQMTVGAPKLTLEPQRGAKSTDSASSGSGQVTVGAPELTLNPQQGATVTGADASTTRDPVSAGMSEGYGIVRDVARGQSDVARKARDYYGESFNMQGASEDARLLQQFIAQGYSPQEAQAMLATRRRDRDVARGQMFGKMGIAEAERAEQAGRDLVTLGRTMQQGEAAEFDLQNRKEADAAGYLANMASQEGYDWRNDAVAQQKLQAAWQANGGQGDFDPAWADSFTSSSQATVADQYVNSILNSDSYQNWYNDLPDVSTQDPDTGEWTLGKDRAEEALNEFAALLMFQGFEPTLDSDGDVAFVDVGGTVLGGDGDVPPPDWSKDPEAWTAGWSDNNYEAFGVTTTGMQQYRDAHGGNPPEDSDAWNEWNMNQRTFDYTDPDEITAAKDVLDMDDTVASSGVSVEPQMLDLYLRSTGGSLKSAQDYVDWAESVGDPGDIRDALREGTTDALENSDSDMLLNAVKAQKLFASQGEYSDDPQAWEDAIDAAGFDSEDEARWYADNVLKGSADLTFNDNTNTESLGIGPHHRTVAWRGSTATQLNLPRGNADAWAADNAGSPVVINGKTYILAPQSELYKFGKTSGGGNDEEYNKGWTFSEGYYAFDPQSEKWVVLSPNTFDTYPPSYKGSNNTENPSSPGWMILEPSDHEQWERYDPQL
jgi:hypothetical protein